MFNFNTFFYSIDVDAILYNTKSLPCNWNGWQHVDKDERHIMTGDLRVVSENKWRNILCESSDFEKKLKQLLLKVVMIVLMLGALKTNIQDIFGRLLNQIDW